MFGLGKSRELGRDAKALSLKQEASETSEARAEAPQKVEAGSKRERPDFVALAKQRVESFQTKKESRWSKIKSGFKSARDFVLTLDARTAYRAGQAKDVAVEGAQFVASKTAEGARAAGRGAKAAGEFGVGMAVAGAEATAEGARFVAGKTADAGRAVGRGAIATAEFGAGVVGAGAVAAAEAGKFVYKEGKQGAEIAWQGITRGVESAHNKFNDARSAISEKYRSAKEAVLNGAEIMRFKAEQLKFNAFKTLETSFAQRAGFSEQKMADIQERANKRLEAKGISPQESQVAMAA